MGSVDTLLHQGDGSDHGHQQRFVLAHAVTLWGFNYSAPGAYKGIYITDSDDGASWACENYSVTWMNNAWYLGGSYSGWTISDIEALGT